MIMTEQNKEDLERYKWQARKAEKPEDRKFFSNAVDFLEGRRQPRQMNPWLKKAREVLHKLKEDCTLVSISEEIEETSHIIYDINYGNQRPEDTCERVYYKLLQLRRIKNQNTTNTKTED